MTNLVISKLTMPLPTSSVPTSLVTAPYSKGRIATRRLALAIASCGKITLATTASANKKAQDAKLKATVHEVQNAIEQYYMNVTPNAYPAAASWKADLVAAKKVINALIDDLQAAGLVG